MSKLSLDTAKELFITARKGDTFQLSFTGVQIDSVDITVAYGAVMKIRASESASPIYSWETPNEIVIGTGTITVTVAAASFTAASGTYQYDLKITYPDTTVHTWLYGTFVINPNYSAT